MLLLCTAVQSQLTEARVSAEHALAGALQQYADATGLGRWAGQATTTTASSGIGDSLMYAGVQLRPVARSSTGSIESAGLSMKVQSVDTWKDLIVVRLSKLNGFNSMPMLENSCAAVAAPVLYNYHVSTESSENCKILVLYADMCS